MTLHEQLAAKIEKRKLSKTAAAKAIGVAPASLNKVLAGSSQPNARSLPKYAKFLGLSASKLQAQLDVAKVSLRKRPGRAKFAATKKSATSKLRPSDRRMLASLKSSLKSIDQLRAKVEDAIARLEEKGR